MAIGVRDITNLEELLEVQDDDKIIVIQNGEAKLVSKANAKFGGGTVTVFYADLNDESIIIRLVNVNGDPISAQAAYDAATSGLVYIFMVQAGHDMFLAPYMFGTAKTDTEIVSVLFAVYNNGETLEFYAGANPTGGPRR